tara:strand:- start:12503 stop:12847 length:345 start_codon:yes stop_codon:yes gene_type:complete
MYEDGATELLQGCKCGGKFFFYMKKQDIKTVQEMTVKLTKEDKQQMESDALDLVGEKKPSMPVVLDLESIRVLKPGKFEIDLVDLFKGKPLVYKLEDGKYIIDIVSTFNSTKDN